MLDQHMHETMSIEMALVGPTDGTEKTGGVLVAIIHK